MEHTVTRVTRLILYIYIRASYYGPILYFIYIHTR